MGSTWACATERHERCDAIVFCDCECHDDVWFALWNEVNEVNE